MGFQLFDELNRTTHAYCAAHGMASAELYGTPPNEAELETSHLIDMGVPAEAAIPVFKVHKAKHLKYWPRTPLQRLGYIEAQIEQGCYREMPKDHKQCPQCEQIKPHSAFAVDNGRSGQIKLKS